MSNSRIKGITVELDGDTRGLTDALKNVNKESSKVTSELKEVERALKIDPGNIELVSQKQQLLAEQIQNTSQKLDVLKQAQAQVEQQFANGDIDAEQYRAFQRELATTEAALKSYEQQMRTTSDNYTNLKNANKDLETFFAATKTEVNDFADVLGTRLANAIQQGSASTDQINRALTLMGQKALGAGADVDKMMDSLKNINESGLNGVKNEFADIAKAANKAEDEVNGFGDSLKNVAAGLVAGGGIAVALEQALSMDTLDTQIDISMNLNEEDAVKVRQSIMETASILGDEEAAYEGIRRQITLNKDASIEANMKIVEGARAVSFAYKEIDFKELIQETHEIGKELGISQEEALAMTHSLLKIGFPSEQLDIIAEYGSQLKRAGFNAQEIQAIMEAGVKTGTWNIDILLDGLKEGRIVAAEFGQGVDKAMKEAIKGTHISAEELEKWGQAVAAGGKEGEVAMNQMITALMGVENETKRNELGVKMFGTLWEEVGPSIAQTLQTYKENMRTSKENTDQLNETVGKLDDSTVASLAEATANLKTAMAPLLITVAELVTKIINWISENPKLTASLVAIAGVIGTLVAAFATLMPAIGSLIGLLGGGATAAGIFGGALAVITGPVGIAVAAIAGLAAGVGILYSKWDEFRELSPAIQGAIAVIVPGVVAITGAIKTVQEAMSPAIEQVDLFGIGVSEATAKAVGGYLKLETDATNAMHQLAWSQETITQEMATKMIGMYDQMGQQVLTEMQADHAAQLQETTNFYAQNNTLTEQEEAQILARMKEKQAAQEVSIQEGNARIKEIWQTAANEKRGITEEEAAQIDLINAQMKENAVKHLSESEREQKLILERLKTDSSAITATQAAEVVKNSEKQRKDSVNAAEKQYNETVMNLQMQRDELGIISEEQYQKLKKDAEKTRDDAVKSANDMHNNVVSEAKAQAGEHVQQVDWETGQVKTKWRMLKEDVGRSVRETAESTIKSFNEMFTGVKKWMSEVETTVKKSWEAAKKVFSVDSMVQIGRDVINGLIKGIGEKFGDVRKKVEELASLIPDWAKDILGIHSPANVFVQFKVKNAAQTAKQFVSKPNLPKIKIELAGVVE
jgi:phage-related minor tail protein